MVMPQSSVAEVDALHRWKNHLTAPGAGASTLRAGVLRAALFPQPQQPLWFHGLWALFRFLCLTAGEGAKGVSALRAERGVQIQGLFPLKKLLTPVISGKRAMRKDISL